MKRLTIVATFLVAALGLLAGFSGAAAADTLSPSPITFESSQGYALGDINGQPGDGNSWSKTGSYDANVVSTPLYGFGQALQISDATTSGNFGDQTFSPGLSDVAGESGQSNFEASFQIGTTSGAEQTGLHMSVSPDNGSGGRMSYLRFEDQGTGIHVFFDDVTDAGPFYKPATFNETDIATLDRASAHTIRFSMNLVAGPGNDVVDIYIDGQLKATGTSWENYYRYDNENTGSAAPVPTVSKLLFRESGTADSTHVGNGFLVDGVALSSATPTCKTTGFVRDGIDMTAAQIGGNVTGELDATGCNIGVYYGHGSTGSVDRADVHGANYFGVVNNGGIVSVTSSTVTQIGEPVFNGTQHGVGIYFAVEGNSTGTITANHVTNYQKNGIVVNGIGSSALSASKSIAPHALGW